MESLTVDDKVDFSLDDNDHKVIFRPSWLTIYDMVLPLYFTREDIVVNISQTFDRLFSEKYGRLAVAVLFFVCFTAVVSHFLTFVVQI